MNGRERDWDGSCDRALGVGTPSPHTPHTQNDKAIANSDREAPVQENPFQNGWDYLNRARQLAPDSGIVEVTQDIVDRIHICTWIGKHINAVNSQLYACLDACHQCFQKSQQREIQILAVPLSSHLGIDGFCNILLDPVAIMIDVGRVAPSDWLGLVAHEYAHAHLKSPGHDRSFFEVLTHICLGLGLQPPPAESTDSAIASAQLRHWPHCKPLPDPLAFWKGLGEF